jgi:hypothetical protein
MVFWLAEGQRNQHRAGGRHMLTQKTQQWPKSCGAATSLVARVELGDVIALTDTQENLIYNALKVPRGGLGAFEILPHSIATYMQQQGHQAEIIESPMTGNILLNLHAGLGGLYALYTHGVNNSTFQKTIRDPQETDLANNGRMFLVVKFAGSNLTHYVLARSENHQCYIMNPDPGTDEQIRFPMTGTFIKTNRNNADGMGPRQYKFLGIAVRVW